MSTDEFLTRLDGVVDEWTVTRDRAVSPDAARYQPDPPAFADTRRYAAPTWSPTAGRIQAPLVCTPYQLEMANAFGSCPRPPLAVRVASAPGRLLEYLWLWHYNRHARPR